MKKFAMFSVAFVLLASGLGTTYADPGDPILMEGCTVISPWDDSANRYQTFTPHYPLLGGVTVYTDGTDGGSLTSVSVVGAEGALYTWFVNQSIQGRVQLNVPQGVLVLVRPGHSYKIRMTATGLYSWDVCEAGNYPDGYGEGLPEGYDFMFETFAAVSPL